MLLVQKEKERGGGAGKRWRDREMGGGRRERKKGRENKREPAGVGVRLHADSQACEALITEIRDRWEPIHTKLYILSLTHTHTHTHTITL